MDIKSEVEIKDEILECPEDRINSKKCELKTGLEKTQEKNIEQEKDVKENMKVKEEPFDKEYAEDLQPFDQVFVLDGIKIFPNSGAKFASPNRIKIEEPNEAVSIKSELREIEEDPLLEEEQINNDIIKPEKIGKLNPQHVKSLIGVADRGEQCSKVKSSESNPSTSVTFDQAIEENCQDYFCKFCSFTFKNKDELASHLKTHDKKKLNCTNSSFESNQNFNLKNLQTHCNMKSFKCSECSYKSNLKSNLNHHLLSHSNLKLFKCSECSYECKRKGNLKTHLLIHSKSKLFKCSECSYECNQKRYLKLHLLTHSNLKLFKCSECSYECNQKGHLKTHLLTHSNLKLFKCSECSYECNCKSSLKTHLLTHSSLKLFKCSECSYECNHKSSLKTHLLTHSNLKLFKCSECGHECNGKSNLKIHLLNHRVLKLFKCSECSYEFDNKSSLKNHLLTHKYADILPRSIPTLPRSMPSFSGWRKSERGGDLSETKPKCALNSSGLPGQPDKHPGRFCLVERTDLNRP